MKPYSEIWNLVLPNTKVIRDGILLNIESANHVVQNKIEGAIVECGVWEGGSMAAMLYRLVDKNSTTHDVYLFDTYAGMTQPTEEDSKYNSDKLAQAKFEQMQREDHNEWCYAPLDVVKCVIEKTNYPEDKIHYVVGDVLETLPQTDIPKIALLRIDVDFYEGTKTCLEHLYPHVVEGGIVIFDDYGVWKGARKAADEYLDKENVKLQHVKHNAWFYKN